jgi:hypothetical protein|tara:strand:- start:12993 stop:14054 length:1062 start_codon:yes stop_codon:yes gene_type:complete
MENQTLERAIIALTEEVPLQVRAVDREVPKPRYRADALIELGENAVPYVVDIKPRATQANLGAIVDHLRLLQDHYGAEGGMLVTDYVNPNLAERLKQLQLQFMDTAGNAYINAPGTFIYIRGNKLPETFTAAETNRAFEPTGLKVVYAFLKDPELVNRPYRHIADVTGVANGTIGWVMHGLREAGYVRDLGRDRGKRLVDLEGLFRRWVDAYPLKLQKKLHLGTWTARNPLWWVDVVIEEFGAVWGGELAADKLTHYLQPKDATVYLPKERLKEFVNGVRLRRVGENPNTDEGVVRLFDLFWTPDTQWHETTDPILTYADLTTTGHPRNLEAAKLVYEKYIDRHLREAAQRGR